MGCSLRQVRVRQRLDVRDLRWLVNFDLQVRGPRGPDSLPGGRA